MLTVWDRFAQCTAPGRMWPGAVKSASLHIIHVFG